MIDGYRLTEHMWTDCDTAPHDVTECHELRRHLDNDHDPEAKIFALNECESFLGMLVAHSDLHATGSN